MYITSVVFDLHVPQCIILVTVLNIFEYNIFITYDIFIVAEEPFWMNGNYNFIKTNILRYHI